jgi:hypothetical protein
MGFPTSSGLTTQETAGLLYKINYLSQEITACSIYWFRPLHNFHKKPGGMGFQPML